MTRLLPDAAPLADLRPEIERVGGLLRGPLRAVLEGVAGRPPRPTRIAGAIGLDKSLASRFVRAVAADTDLALMHIVPSPEGLRILAHRAERRADSRIIAELLRATESFQHLLDRTPGGRATIDAHISEASLVVRERSEQSARQAAFKSMSFLLGHFSETLSTTLFLAPSADGRTVDGIEVHRRIGLSRMRPSTPLALLSVFTTPEDKLAPGSVVFETIDGGQRQSAPTAYLLPQFSSSPLPELEVMHDGDISTLVLAGDPRLTAPTRLTSAFRLRNVWPIEPTEHMQSVRGYILHVPCRRMVRDLFVAESLYPGASPRVTFALPGPRGRAPQPDDQGPRHYASVDLSATIEQLPSGNKAYWLPGSPDQEQLIHHVLERSGLATTRFRGWRFSVTYPVPMIEMLLWLEHPGVPRGQEGTR